MTNRSDLVREVESALTRAPEKTQSGRYAVYVPGAVVIGRFDKKAQAREVALKWTEAVPDVVIVDRDAEGSSG